jgi:hypothetical protein
VLQINRYFAQDSILVFYEIGIEPKALFSFKPDMKYYELQQPRFVFGLAYKLCCAVCTAY